MISVDPLRTQCHREGAAGCLYHISYILNAGNRYPVLLLKDALEKCSSTGSREQIEKGAPEPKGRP